VSWGKNKKETCAKHKIDRSQNGRSKNRVAQKKRLDGRTHDNSI